MTNVRPNTLATMVVIGAALAMLPAVTSKAGLALATEVSTVLAIAMMWNLLAGFAGIVFIGIPLFVGIGGYTLYLLANWLAVPPYLLILPAGISSTIAALVLSPLLFRLNGAQLAIGSWVMAEIIRLAVLLLPSLGGGAGINLEVMRLVARSWRLPLNYYAGALALFLAVVVTVAIMRSKLGLALRAIRDSEAAAEAMGVNVVGTRRATLAAAAFVTGIAGAAFYISSLQISPASAFSINWTALAIFIVILGGIGSIEGPVIGAIVYFLLRETLSDLGTGYFILSGLLAIAITIFMPIGLWGFLRKYTGFDFLPAEHFPSSNPDILRGKS